MERIKNIQYKTLADNWYVLRKYTYEYLTSAGNWEVQEREAYDRGNGATILLYNTDQNTVILTRQFRLPTYVNGNPTGMLMEACAGLLDQDEPEVCIRRETAEETGYTIGEVHKVMEAYMSPGSVTEILYFFIAPYTTDMKKQKGGGDSNEQEDIEVCEIEFQQVLRMVNSGEIKDGKTIMLIQYLQLHNILTWQAPS